MWGVITLRSKFVLVLRGNIRVNISLLGEVGQKPPVFQSLMGLLPGEGMAVFLYPSQSLIDHKLFPLTTYSLRFCDQRSGPRTRSLAIATA